MNLPAADFRLPDLDGQMHLPSAALGRILVLNFWSVECPWSARTDQLLREWRTGWGERVAVWTIAANAGEDPAEQRREAAARGLQLLLLDPGHQAADLYQAETTPHVFVIDAAGSLRYRGAVDDVTFRQRSPTRFYLREAVEALLAGQAPPLAETPAYGCTILRG